MDNSYIKLRGSFIPSAMNQHLISGIINVRKLHSLISMIQLTMMKLLAITSLHKFMTENIT